MSKQTEWPDFFLIGATRCGTTTIYHYLQQHPNICMSAVKEPGFFTELEETDWHCESYLNLFNREDKHKISGEGSTNYLYDAENVPGNIKEVQPGAKFIISLRDPVDRAFSHYRQRKYRGIEEDSFEKAIELDLEADKSEYPEVLPYFKKGLYYQQISKFLNFFDREQFIFLKFESFINNPEQEMREVFEFLEVEPDVELSDIGRSNPGGGVRFKFINKLIYKNNLIKKLLQVITPKLLRRKGAEILLEWNHKKTEDKEQLSEEMAKRLRKLYLPEINKLENLLKWDLSNWKN